MAKEITHTENYGIILHQKDLLVLYQTLCMDIIDIIF